MFGSEPCELSHGFSGVFDSKKNIYIYNSKDDLSCKVKRLLQKPMFKELKRTFLFTTITNFDFEEHDSTAEFCYWVYNKYQTNRIDFAAAVQVKLLISR